MSPEQQLQDLEAKLYRLDQERVTVLREINLLREQIEKENETRRIILGRQARPDSSPVDNLATPLSFEGRMVQYAGRLHRLSEGKSDVRIIDFSDSYNVMLLKMYRNRIKAYWKMGYVIEETLQLT